MAPHRAAALLPTLPPQPLCTDVLREKYLRPGERGEDDVFDRVAGALAAAEAPAQRAAWTARFRAHLARGAIGAGRIMATAGTGLPATQINCFVQPIGDSGPDGDGDGLPGVDEALREAAMTLQRGGGVGYDFSRIRPAGAVGAAGGPCAAIDRFDALGSTVEGIGARRGAQMAVLRIDHPDIVDVVTAKRTPGRWTHFNVSVAVPDAFLHAVEANGDWALVHRAEPAAPPLAAGAARREDGRWVYRHVRPGRFGMP